MTTDRRTYGWKQIAAGTAPVTAWEAVRSMFVGDGDTIPPGTVGTNGKVYVGAIDMFGQEIGEIEGDCAHLLRALIMKTREEPCKYIVYDLENMSWAVALRH